jgi:hypothetical protein
MWYERDPSHQWPVGEHVILNSHSRFQCNLPKECDRLWGLGVRVLGYRSRSPGFDSRRYQIFRKVMGLESTQPREGNWGATRLHGVTLQKILLFIIAAMKRIKYIIVNYEDFCFLWDITLYNVLKVTRCFRGTFRLHRQDVKCIGEWPRYKGALQNLQFSHGSLWILVGHSTIYSAESQSKFGWVFPGNGGDMYLRNVGSLLKDCMQHAPRDMNPNDRRCEKLSRLQTARWSHKPRFYFIFGNSGIRKVAGSTPIPKWSALFRGWIE